jgi:hypothetical protein
MLLPQSYKPVSEFPKPVLLEQKPTDEGVALEKISWYMKFSGGVQAGGTIVAPVKGLLVPHGSIVASL